MSGPRIVAVEALPLTARFADLYGGEAAIPAHILRPASHFTGIPRTGQYSTLVTVRTDDGLTGHGEAWGLPLPEATALWVERLITPVLVGRAADDIDGIWSELTGYFARVGHSTSIAMEALSGVDIALWDLAGQRAGSPIHALLGGARRDAIDCYASPIMFAENEAETRAQARAFADEGFGAIKIKAGRGVERDIADVAAVRNELGSDVRILVDVNGGYDLAAATRLAGGLAAHDVYWLEEPLPPTALADMAELRRRSPLPIALGENEFNEAQFSVFLDQGCADIVMPNVTRAGGITGTRRIAALAARNGAGFSLHGVGATIMQYASVHLLAALEASALFEINRFPNPLRETLGSPPLVLREGRLAVPDRPGLGLTVATGAIDRFARAA